MGDFLKNATALIESSTAMLKEDNDRAAARSTRNVIAVRGRPGRPVFVAVLPKTAKRHGWKVVA